MPNYRHERATEDDARRIIDGLETEDARREHELRVAYPKLTAPDRTPPRVENIG
jgi:plasmid stability protein